MRVTRHRFVSAVGEIGTRTDRATQNRASSGQSALPDRRDETILRNFAGKELQARFVASDRAHGRVGRQCQIPTTSLVGKRVADHIHVNGMTAAGSFCGQSRNFALQSRRLSGAPMMGSVECIATDCAERRRSRRRLITAPSSLQFIVMAMSRSRPPTCLRRTDARTSGVR
jgi:hypothetical protein